MNEPQPTFLAAELFGAAQIRNFLLRPAPQLAVSAANRLISGDHRELELDALNQDQIYASSKLPRSCNWNLAGYRASVDMRRAGVDYQKRYLKILEHRSHL